MKQFENAMPELPKLRTTEYDEEGTLRFVMMDRTNESIDIEKEWVLDLSDML